MLFRYAIVNTAASQVVNVIEYGAAPTNPPPGFDQGIIAVQHDAADVRWTWDGSNLVAPVVVVTPQPPVTTVLSQDLMAQFTTADAAKIRAAVDSSPLFWLLWSALQAQKDPMLVANERFLAGWNALIQVLGQERMAEISTALGVTIT